jgi:hypothetical protein
MGNRCAIISRIWLKFVLNPNFFLFLSMTRTIIKCTSLSVFAVASHGTQVRNGEVAKLKPKPRRVPTGTAVLSMCYPPHTVTKLAFSSREIYSHCHEPLP